MPGTTCPHGVPSTAGSSLQDLQLGLERGTEATPLAEWETTVRVRTVRNCRTEPIFWGWGTEGEREEALENALLLSRAQRVSDTINLHVRRHLSCVSIMTSIPVYHCSSALTTTKKSLRISRDPLYPCFPFPSLTVFSLETPESPYPVSSYIAFISFHSWRNAFKEAFKGEILLKNPPFGICILFPSYLSISNIASNLYSNEFSSRLHYSYVSLGHLGGSVS